MTERGILPKRFVIRTAEKRKISRLNPTLEDTIEDIKLKVEDKNLKWREEETKKRKTKT